MSFATTNQTGLYYVEESTWGTTPSTPTLQELRLTGESLNYDIENTTSEELRSDRMTSDTVQTGQSTSGGVDFELSFGTYDSLFESALYQAFVTGNNNGSTDRLVSSATANEEIDFATGGTITFGIAHAVNYVAGQRIKVSGASNSNNDGMYSVVSVSGQALTVSPAPGTDKSETIQGVVVQGSKDYVSAGSTASNLDVVAATSGTITFGIAHAHNFVIGQWVQAGGFTDSSLNGVYHRITGVSGNTITVTPAPAANETNQTGGWVSGARLRNAPTAAGITEKSFTVQKRFNDATSVIYQNLTGMIVDGFSFNFDTGSILGGTFNFMGRGSELGAIAGSTDRLATTTSVMNSVSNLVNIEFDDTDTSASIISMTLETTGNLRAQKAVGSLPAVGVGTGRQEISGSISVYFENITEYQKFLDNTSFKISFRLQDNDGNAYVITMPKVKYEGSTMNAGGLDGDIELAGNWRALLGTVGGVNFMMEIDRLPSTF